VCSGMGGAVEVEEGNLVVVEYSSKKRSLMEKTTEYVPPYGVG
jgi:hypothetical protein